MTQSDDTRADLPAEPSPRRPVRSYVIRSGRLTSSQRKALDTWSADFVVDYRPEPLNLSTLFGNSNPVVVEIGFGMGDSLLTMAHQNPGVNYIGIEVHRPGLGKLLMGIGKEGLNNIRLINHDAKEVMENCLADASLDGIQIFFPDPWHKKRHNKRRLIQDEFVVLLQRKLKPGGLLHLATDWQPYAEQMLEVLEGCGQLRNEAGPGNYSPPGDRPATKFEKRGIKLGHGVWDLQFRRLTDNAAG